MKRFKTLKVEEELYNLLKEMANDAEVTFSDIIKASLEGALEYASLLDALEPVAKRLFRRVQRAEAQEFFESLGIDQL